MRLRRAPQRTGCLTQQRQHLLRQLVGLRHHRRAGLLQDLGARQVGSFCGEVGVGDTAAGSRLVLDGDLQVADDAVEAVLHCAVQRAFRGDRGQCRVDVGQCGR